MQKFAIAVGLILSVLLLTGSNLHAEVDVPWAWIQQEAISKTVGEVTQLLSPAGAKAGFPDKRPAKLENKSFEALYRYAANLSEKGRGIFAEMIGKNRFPVKVDLGARYFLKRLEIGAREYAEKTGNERVHEFLCRDFASACDIGLAEMQLWASPEAVFTMEYLWYDRVREGLDRVKAKMPMIPEGIAPAGAREIWRKAASALVSAGNEAGMTASQIGGFQFPAWRLHFAVKYFKAASKAAVVNLWYSDNADSAFWVDACSRLRNDVSRLTSEIDTLLATLIK